MEFRILGPLQVVDEGRTLPLGGGRQLALLAVLLLHANETVSVDVLVDELWGESSPPTAAKIVRNAVSLLRRELGDRLVTAPPGYLLRVEPGELDRELVERALAGGELPALEEALSLWRGQPLSQFAYEPFAQAEIARLEELRLSVLEARFDAELACGRHASVVAELEILVKEHPLRERLSAQLMLALYRSGRQAGALEAYNRARRHLAEELGIEPGPALRELERQVLAHDEALGRPAPPPKPPPRPPRQRLRPRVLASAGVALAAIAGAAFSLTRDSAGGLSSVAANHVAVIDAGSREVIAAIPVGIRPGPITASSRDVWVGNLGDRTLARIDARELVPTATLTLDHRTPTALAAGRAGVWVLHGGSGRLAHVEQQFGRVSVTVRVTERPYTDASGGVSLDGTIVWAAFGDSTLARVRDPSGAVTGRGLAGSVPSAVAVGGRSVWVANSGAATVQRFDPETFDQGPIRTLAVGRHPVAIAFGEGALWVANRGDDSVTRIDPSTGAISTIRVGGEPAGIAVGAGAIWVANAADGTVSRIDPEDEEVTDTVELGSSPAGVAVARGLVWVTAQAP